jgi:hypothetical protein
MTENTKDFKKLEGQKPECTLHAHINVCFVSVPCLKVLSPHVTGGPADNKSVR